MQQISSGTLELVGRLFPGRLMVRPVEVGRALGFADQTIRNWLVLGTFPLPTQLVGNKKLVRVVDVAAYIERNNSTEPAQAHVIPPPPPPRRGRPSAEEVAAARAAGFDGVWQWREAFVREQRGQQ